MKTITKKEIVYFIIIGILLVSLVTVSALWAVSARKKEEPSYFDRKCAAFELENAHLSKGQIVFIGDSITDFYPLDDFYADLPLSVYNRGIARDKTGGVLSRLETSVLALEPSKISLLIGINDINGGVPEEKILSNYGEILDRIAARLPNAEVFCISVLPMNSDVASFKIDLETGTARVKSLNEKLRPLVEGRGYTFVNLFPLLADANDHLIEAYSADGLHPSAAGYAVWTSALKPQLQ